MKAQLIIILVLIAGYFSLGIYTIPNDNYYYYDGSTTVYVRLNTGLPFETVYGETGGLKTSINSILVVSSRKLFTIKHRD